MSSLSRRSLLGATAVTAVTGMTSTSFASAARAETTNAAVPQLQIDFFQPLWALPGTATDVYINVRNVSGETYVNPEPLQFDIKIVRASGAVRQRGWTRALSSYGTVRNINSYADFNSQTAWNLFTWTIKAGTVFSYDRTVPVDAVIGLGDGLALGGRLTNYLTVTGNGVNVDSRTPGATKGPFSPTGTF